MICSRCIMDDSDPQISFDDHGYCNHCRNYFEKAQTAFQPTSLLREQVNRIKREEASNEYDCLLGVSGGTDSSYTAYLAHQYGLRTLLVHFDNGWNTPEAQHNVKAIVENTGFDFIVESSDPNELRDLQLSYLKAGVVNFEAITDHAIWASVYKMVEKHNVHYLLKGTNWATEGILPKSWGYNHMDSVNIKAIQREYGSLKLRTYPMMSILHFVYLTQFKGVREVKPLNHILYNPYEARKTLADEWGLQDYGGKHGESVCTRFYQGHILPIRWGIDKRRAHYSTLICSGSMSRQHALALVKEPAYSQERYESDLAFFLDKLGITKDDFTQLMNLPKRNHRDFATNQRTWNFLRFILSVYRKMRRTIW